MQRSTSALVPCLVVLSLAGGLGACEDARQGEPAGKVSEFSGGVNADDTPEPEPEEPEATSAAPERPEWVTKGSSYTDEEGNRFGVGVASGIKNEALARTTASNRARAELAKLDGTASTKVVEGEGTRSVTTVVTNTQAGVEIVAQWVDPSTGTVYALARQAK